MRTLGLFALAVIFAPGVSRAESLIVHQVTGPVPDASMTEGRITAGTGACTTCQSGSLDQYPGSCCPNGNAACCAALWSNYCRDKHPCWTPGMSRHHGTLGCGISGCGISGCGISGCGCGGCDFLKHPCLIGTCGACRKSAVQCVSAPASKNCESCTAPGCDQAASAEAGSSNGKGPEPPEPPEPTVEPGTAIQPPVVGPEATPADDVPPAPSAKRWSFPFGRKSSPSSDGVRVRTLPTAKRRFPTSR